jgi:hypothetical protein
VFYALDLDTLSEIISVTYQDELNASKFATVHFDLNVYLTGTDVGAHPFGNTVVINSQSSFRTSQYYLH